MQFTICPNAWQTEIYGLLRTNFIGVKSGNGAFKACSNYRPKHKTKEVEQ